MLSYVLRDLVRNPRRTLASIAGVTLAVGLFSGISFFVDSSSSQMTARAISPVAIDMQAGLVRPLDNPPPNLDAIRRAIAGVADVKVVEPFALVDPPRDAFAPRGRPSHSRSRSSPSTRPTSARSRWSGSPGARTGRGPRC